MTNITPTGKAAPQTIPNTLTQVTGYLAGIAGYLAKVSFIGPVVSRFYRCDSPPTMTGPLSTLPLESLKTIASYLGEKDQMQISATNRYCRSFFKGFRTAQLINRKDIPAIEKEIRRAQEAYQADPRVQKMQDIAIAQAGAGFLDSATQTLQSINPATPLIRRLEAHQYQKQNDAAQLMKAHQKLLNV